MKKVFNEHDYLTECGNHPISLKISWTMVEEPKSSREE